MPRISQGIPPQQVHRRTLRLSPIEGKKLAAAAPQQPAQNAHEARRHAVPGQEHRPLLQGLRLGVNGRERIVFEHDDSPVRSLLQDRKHFAVHERVGQIWQNRQYQHHSAIRLPHSCWLGRRTFAGQHCRKGRKHQVESTLPGAAHHFAQEQQRTPANRPTRIIDDLRARSPRASDRRQRRWRMWPTSPHDRAATHRREASR